MRFKGSWRTPSASAPSRKSWPFLPIRSGSTARTRSISSAASYSGARSAAHSIPCSVTQPASTLSGARKQVPELITVVPPTARPTGVGIAGRPSAIVRPPSR